MNKKGQLQIEILSRTLSEKELQELYKKYCDAMKVNRHGGKPTDKQIRLANLVKAYGYKGAAKKVGVPVGEAYYAVGRIGKWMFLTHN